MISLIIDIIFYLNLLTLIGSLIYLKNKNATIGLSAFLVVFFLWTILGFKIFLSLESEGVNHHLENELFDVLSDDSLLVSELLMSVFFISLAFGVCFLSYNVKEASKLVYYGSPVLPVVIVALATLYSLNFSYEVVNQSIDSGFTAYQYSRFHNQNVTFQFIRDLGIILSVIYIFIFRHEKLIFRIALVLSYFSLVVCSIALGDRSSFAVSIILGFTLFYDCYRFSIFKNIKFLMFLVFALSIFSLAALRGINFVDLLSVDSEKVFSIWNFIPVTEFLAAQMSLYGVISNQVDLLYGSSFVNLIGSLMTPFGFSPDLFLPEYVHYAKGVGAPESKGYTIHHVTSWYLNFWIFGPLLSATVLLSILLFFNRWSKSSYYGHLGMCLFCALSLLLVRSGIEGYKGVLIYTCFVPLFVVKLASKNGLASFFRLFTKPVNAINGFEDK